MQKFIVSTISVVLAMLISVKSVAQNQSKKCSFDEFAVLFTSNKIEIPIIYKDLQNIDFKARPEIGCNLYNTFIVLEQKNKPHRCTIDGRTFDASYGLLDEDDNKVYALGYIKHNKYNIFISRIETNIESKTIIDYNVFSKNGDLLSVLCLSEVEHLYYNGKYEKDTIYIASIVSSNNFIQYEENRYGVNVKIDYQLQEDGILKEVTKSIIGQYEVVDDDGYVNVREKPDVKSNVLYTIESGSVIIAQKEASSKWFQVISIEDSDKKGGYIHSSRLRNYW
ncbi:MAG: SH3 domain-containing protein [Marinilabiliaceae bacterium]|nr:SH3 domain-containing protein [Marinilabiliaceae bacterium]